MTLSGTEPGAPDEISDDAARSSPAPPTAERAVEDIQVAALRAQVRHLTAALDEARAEIAHLEALSLSDPLTGLLNRRGFARDLARAIAFNARYGSQAGLLLIDLDRFKPINDNIGHAAGDAALNHIARLLKDHLRTSDSIARLGGDEFGILLWQVDEDLAWRKAAELEGLAETTAMTFEAHRFAVGCSIGVTTLRPDDGADTALMRADRSMYDRKRARRNSALRR